MAAPATSVVPWSAAAPRAAVNQDGGWTASADASDVMPSREPDPAAGWPPGGPRMRASTRVMSSSPCWRSAWVTCSQASSSEAAGSASAMPSASRSAAMPSSSGRLRLSTSPSVYRASVAPGGSGACVVSNASAASPSGSPAGRSSTSVSPPGSTSTGGRCPARAMTREPGGRVDHGVDAGRERLGHARAPSRPAGAGSRRAAGPARPGYAPRCAAAPSPRPPPGRGPSRPRRSARPGRRAAATMSCQSPPTTLAPTGQVAEATSRPAGTRAGRAAARAAGRARSAARGGTAARCRCRPPPSRPARRPPRCPRG